MWVEVFRRRNPRDFEQVIDFQDVVTCLPVVRKVLRGFRDESAYRTARDAMFALKSRTLGSL